MAIEKIDTAESADLALLVSGPQFITAFRRVQFVATERFELRASVSSIANIASEAEAAKALIALMALAHCKGWDIAQRAVTALGSRGAKE